MPIRPGDIGQPLSSHESLPTAENFARPALGHSRCSDWTPTAPRSQRISEAERIRNLLAGKLIVILAEVETKDWVWFEEGLAYDNARLPQALIVTRGFYRKARLCRGRFEVLALARDSADDGRGLFQARRYHGFRRKADDAAGVRSATAGGHGNGFSLPCSVARGRQYRVASGRDARFFVVSRQQ